MKQETLEEAGKFAEKRYLERVNNFQMCDFKDGVIEGAKWQAERMYSEAEVRKLLLTQRGNCYVAILTKTRDRELASLSISAPEPSGKNGWVKQFKKK
jgi:hypothetical protein